MNKIPHNSTNLQQDRCCLKHTWSN